MKKPKPIDELPPTALSADDNETRDRLAHHVMSVCVTDLSRQLAEGDVKIEDAPRAVNFIAALSYLMADAMLRARDAK